MSTAASFLKRESYSSHGSPSNSLLALTITELYANKSLTRSGFFIALMVMNELKHITHSSIVLICFTGGFPLAGAKTSNSVGWGMPRRDGSNSPSSINSFRHILSASFFGTGGEWGPTESACIVSSLIADDADGSEASGVSKDTSGLLVAAVVAVTATAGLDAVENVLTPARADTLGRQPTLGRVGGRVGGTVVGVSEPVDAK